ncbi:MAG TPA: type II/IV secretion system ATPase subunit [Nitrososphaera sp.]|nr:type II/IV secretion system ATPase subunit [Nitrososphaera sp.]
MSQFIENENFKNVAPNNATITDPKLIRAIQASPHLMNYISKFVRNGFPLPTFHEQLETTLKYIQTPNLVYPIGNQIFVHINALSSGGDGFTDYVIIDPEPPYAPLIALVDKMFAIRAGSIQPPAEHNEKLLFAEKYLHEICAISKTPVNYDDVMKLDKGRSMKLKRIPVYEKDFDNLKYHFMKRHIGSGLLEPFLLDPYLEDISIAGAGNIYLVHKVFGSLRVPIVLTHEEIDDLIISMSEQFGKSISHSRPIVDTSLADGSRINIIFGADISRKGTNATIRKFTKVPLSITQLISSHTLDSREAAYLWMMLNEGMSMFVCGETASGKTTTMTAISAFIPSTWKIVSIEDTQEITLPHPNWVNEITRDTGSTYSSVTMFDLLKAALRQRPNYIIVGEIRGIEGNVAFQAMQTGHPVISTFHAASVQSLVQRITGHPINVPKTHVDNLNIALFQSAVHGKDAKMVRRVITINEIVGYNSSTDNVLFIPVFNWDPGTDTAVYRGKGSSSLFLTKLLVRRGLTRKDEGLLYEELELRAKILEALIAKKVFSYFDVYSHITKAREVGIELYLKSLR